MSSNIGDLPAEILQNIFNRLSYKDLVRVIVVNERFHQVIKRYGILKKKRIALKNYDKVEITASKKFGFVFKVSGTHEYEHSNTQPAEIIKYMFDQQLKIGSFKVLQFKAMSLSDSVLDQLMSMNANLSLIEVLHVDSCEVDFTNRKMNEFLNHLSSLAKFIVLDSKIAKMRCYVNDVSIAESIRFLCGEKKTKICFQTETYQIIFVRDDKYSKTYFPFHSVQLPHNTVRHVSSLEFEKMDITEEVLKALTENGLNLSSIEELIFMDCKFMLPKEKMREFLHSINLKSLIVENEVERDFFDMRINRNVFNLEIWRNSQSISKDHPFLSQKFIRKYIGKKYKKKTEKKLDSTMKEIELRGELGSAEFHVIDEDVGWFLKYTLILTVF